MKKVMEHIKEKGILPILEICDNNLFNVKNYLIRECNLPKNYNFSRHRKLFEQTLKKAIKDPIKTILLKEISQKLQEDE